METCGNVTDICWRLDHALDNLYGYQITISIFEEVAICKKIGKNKYIYQDGESLKLVSEVMNFSANYITNPDGMQFGFKVGKWMFWDSQLC